MLISLSFPLFPTLPSQESTKKIHLLILPLLNSILFPSTLLPPMLPRKSELYSRFSKLPNLMANGNAFIPLIPLHPNSTAPIAPKSSRFKKDVLFVIHAAILLVPEHKLFHHHHHHHNLFFSFLKKNKKFLKKKNFI